MLHIFVLLCAVTLATSTPLQEPRSRDHCGYEHCPKTDEAVLNVHIVPHTHDDVGWLKTVDQYYYGSRNNIQKAGVQYILDSVVKELWEDPKRKFIYVETAFFWKWWVRQPDSIQEKVRALVSEGRLQFVGGAWSMNDEAAAHYHSTIDQFTWGLSKINSTFGPCALPRVGWQIDPFGHSREFASLLAGMGYDGLFLGRIDYQDKSQRLARKTMETLWRGDDDLGKPSDIFTGVLYNTYSPPPGFCFDVLCNDEPIIDDPVSPMYNVDMKVDTFIKIARNMSKAYRSNNILVTMGEDFQYQDAAMWYTNLDKLILYANLKAAKDGLKVKLFYSTPNCYLKAVKDANPTLPTKQDDYFPYASDPHAYWTGYFTSRPTTKYFERQGNIYLQMAKQLQVLADLEEHNQFVVNGLKSAMGIMQHHDAITGTEKQHVTHDYERLLDQAIEDSLLVPRQAFNKMMQGNASKPAIFSFDRCRLNESSCFTSEQNDKFVVTLYNPVAWKVDVPVRIPVLEGNYEVYAPNGDKIDSQLVDIPQQVREIPTRSSNATHELVFIAYLKPVFYKSFYVRKLKKTKRDVTIIKPNKRTQDLYENINGYWKEIREKTDVEIKNLEDVEENYEERTPDVTKLLKAIDVKNADLDVLKGDQEVNRKLNNLERIINDEYGKEIRNEDLDVKIPEEPTLLKAVDVENVDLDILKGNDDEINRKVNDLERIIKEEKGNVEVKRSREAVNAYPNLSDEEMRMLSDDPMVVEKLEDYFVVENGNMKIHVDNTSGGIKSVTFPNGKAINLTLDHYYYTGKVGDNEKPDARSSGAYIFRPNATGADQAVPIPIQSFHIINGKVVSELRQVRSDNVFTNTKMYHGLHYIETEWLIGPIDITDDIGKEHVVRYETSIVNNGEFFTDSNGRQILKRKLGKRPQYNLSLAEQIAGNYYPVTNEIYIEDDNDRFVVITDRSQGGSSLIEGNVELMLHRRLLHDDAFGVGEALNETLNGKGLVVRGNHRLILTSKDDSFERKTVIETDLQPVVFVSAAGFDLNDWFGLSNCFSWLKSPLPEGIHLLTVEPWGEKLLLRLENYLTKSEDSTKEVDLTTVLQNVKVKGVKETVLSANEWASERERWTWAKENEFSESFNKEYGNVNEVRKAEVDSRLTDDGFKVKLTAKQIRTFIVDYEFYP